MSEVRDVVVVGSGNAALCAAIAARDVGADVLVIEKAFEDLAGGNSKYTAGAMRFAYEGVDDLIPLLEDPDDPRLSVTDFGRYDREQFSKDLLHFNDGRPLSDEQRSLIDESYDAVRWMAEKGIRFEPIYSRQSFEKNGRHVFWGGLTLAARHEGVGLVEREVQTFLSMGGEIRYDCAMLSLESKNGRVAGVRVRNAAGEESSIVSDAVILACGGFESNADLRERHMGAHWRRAKVRGTPHNNGDGLSAALDLGATMNGLFEGCHATPMDLHMPEFGNLDLPHEQRKNYRKICYFLGIMVNAEGKRFVDEGKDFRNYTYAQFGRAILEQPDQFAWQIFDSKVFNLLYEEYRFSDAHYVEAETIEDLVSLLEGVDKAAVRRTIVEFNDAVDDGVDFDPTVRDGRGANGLDVPRTNWAQRIERGPFRAYPVTGGVTFTYGGVKVDEQGSVLREDGSRIDGLYACGEMVGGVFFNGYPGGSGLTSGAVFGRRAGAGAASKRASRSN